MKLGYVCTNFNSSDATCAAVETLRANVGHDVHVVVVDNQSNPSERARLQQTAAPGVEVLFHDSNLGYFGGLNVGIRHLRAARPDIDWMIVGNNDLEFPTDFCASLEATLEEHKDRPVIAPDIVTIDGEHQNPHVITGISPIREFAYDVYYSNYYLGLLVLKTARLLRIFIDRPDEQEWQTAQPIYQGHGAAYLLGPAFFRKFEQLWAPTFMMSEEYFLSKQLSEVGEQVYYDPRISVRHMLHASLETLPGRQRWEFARQAHKVYRKYVGIRGAARIML